MKTKRRDLLWLVWSIKSLYIQCVCNTIPGVRRVSRPVRRPHGSAAAPTRAQWWQCACDPANVCVMVMVMVMTMTKKGEDDNDNEDKVSERVMMTVRWVDG